MTSSGGVPMRLLPVLCLVATAHAAPVNPPAPVPFPGAPGWRLERVVDAHPTKGVTSGQRTDGTVAALRFLDEARLLAGGNDDRVRVLRVDDGRELFASPALVKDIEHVIPCSSGHFGAVTYGGDIVWFEPHPRAPDKWR